MNRILLAVVGFLLVLMALSSSLFVVDQDKIAVIKTFGEIRQIVTEPGLNFNWPLAQTVSMLDKRVQTLENPQTNAVFTSEKKGLVIDWMVKWRIGDARQYVRNNGVIQANLENRLAVAVESAFNEEIAHHTVRGVLSDERAQIIADVQSRLALPARDFGIEIVDLRIRRADFVADLTDVVYKRMVSERTQVANQLRAEGKADQERLEADADKQRSEILAQGFIDAQKIKGEADAQATATYADAFGRDPKFAAFYRSLEAYRASFHNKSDVVVVDSGSEFFKAMRGADSADAAASAHPKH